MPTSFPDHSALIYFIQPALVSKQVPVVFISSLQLTVITLPFTWHCTSAVFSNKRKICSILSSRKTEPVNFLSCNSRRVKKKLTPYHLSNCAAISSNVSPSKQNFPFTQEVYKPASTSRTVICHCRTRACSSGYKTTS